MKIGLYTNLTRDNGAVITRAVYKLLDENGFEVYLSSDLISVDFDKKDIVFYSNEELAKKSDFIVVLGGDGTILRIAKECARFDTPIYAVNTGHKGFLSEINKNELDKIVSDIQAGDYVLDKRKFLKVKLSTENTEYYALNEVVVAQALASRIMKAEISINGTMVDKYSSDGIIVATPTGSTAYSLSAGGPIVAPDVDCFIISPICAHSLHSRPMIVSNTNTVKVTIIDALPGANINIDGQNISKLTKGTFIEVSDSDLSVSFVRRKSFNFYEKLLAKMRYWSSIEV